MGKDKYTGYTYVALSYDKYPFLFVDLNLFVDLYFDVELIYDNILVKIYYSPRSISVFSNFLTL